MAPGRQPLPSGNWLCPCGPPGCRAKDAVNGQTLLSLEGSAHPLGAVAIVGVHRDIPATLLHPRLPAPHSAAAVVRVSHVARMLVLPGWRRNPSGLLRRRLGGPTPGPLPVGQLLEVRVVLLRDSVSPLPPVHAEVHGVLDAVPVPAPA